MMLFEEVSHDIQAHGHDYQQWDLKRFFEQNFTGLVSLHTQYTPVLSSQDV